VDEVHARVLEKGRQTIGVPGIMPHFDFQGKSAEGLGDAEQMHPMAARIGESVGKLHEQRSEAALVCQFGEEGARRTDEVGTDLTAMRERSV
jgi:hypothetical protein